MKMPKSNDNHHKKNQPLLQALCRQQLKQCMLVPEKYSIEIEANHLGKKKK